MVMTVRPSLEEKEKSVNLGKVFRHRAGISVLFDWFHIVFKSLIPNFCLSNNFPLFMLCPLKQKQQMCREPLMSVSTLSSVPGPASSVGWAGLGELAVMGQWEEKKGWKCEEGKRGKGRKNEVWRKSPFSAGSCGWTGSGESGRGNQSHDNICTLLRGSRTPWCIDSHGIQGTDSTQSCKKTPRHCMKDPTEYIYFYVVMSTVTMLHVNVKTCFSNRLYCMPNSTACWG